LDPELSVVIVSYNMVRELPRTLRSLSPSMQRDITPGSYEVIVVDNGSTTPFDEDACRRWLPDMILRRLPVGSPSPVKAVNLGIGLARGELIGVFIDGARLASPGLLSTALAASRLHDWPVIGTIAFHLGPDVQMRSVPNGYNQQVEDALLARSGWENDGYKLFEISALAGSSEKGWFVLPSESNSVFMKSRHWARLGGYDPAFASPGGGYANLDLWKRACSVLEGQPIMLLGEATFHQVHGGVATNSAKPPTAEFKQEYFRLRGESFSAPRRKPWIVGRLNRPALESMRRSLDFWLQDSSRDL
jgi:hypothetical protein